MSNTWKRAAAALRLGLSGLILFVSAACASTSTAAPPNTPGTEVTVRAGAKASGTTMPMPTPTPVPKASETAMPTPTPVPKAASEKTREIPATVNGRADPSESIRLRDGTGGDDQALPIPDKGELKYPNLGSRLDGLVASVEAGQATAEEAAADTPVHSGESVAVTVYLFGSVDGVVAFLRRKWRRPPQRRRGLRGSLRAGNAAGAALRTARRHPGAGNRAAGARAGWLAVNRLSSECGVVMAARGACLAARIPLVCFDQVGAVG